MKKKKIFICGNFGYKTDRFDGQTVKTRALKEELGNEFGLENISFVDTSFVRSNLLKTIYSIVRGMITNTDIILLPDKNAFEFFSYLIPLFFRKKNLYYVVIGGWLPSQVSGNKRYIKFLSLFKGIYVETKGMIDNLEKEELSNVVLMPNFRRYNFPQSSRSVLQGPIKAVLFSRILEEKGVELAINAINNINREYQDTVIKLDIFGPVQDTYVDRFSVLESTFDSSINYRGILAQDKIYNQLSTFDLLLFPTFFESEGFPGTIIDSHISSLPVVASDWAYNSEFIYHGYNGRIFESKNERDLQEQVEYFILNKEELKAYRQNSYQSAKKYHADEVMKILIKDIKG